MRATELINELRAEIGAYGDHEVIFQTWLVSLGDEDGRLGNFKVEAIRRRSMHPFGGVFALCDESAL